ncbi:MAG: hemolysin E [Laribacter sp.]|nr:hemolysin E [Laribacter sp.]MBP9526930.1 hemolysin E [Laribacter sp.]MBP9609249.1 hemolysin E [Laribacter sp.]
MSNEFETAKTAIETADKALDLYNKVLDQLIPWKTFEETIKELTRYKDEYSQKSSTLVGEVKTLLLDCQDKYFESTQSVYEWCGVSGQLLTAYLKLFEEPNEKKAEAQKAILIKVLDEGILKMKASMDCLGRCSSSFNAAAGKLLALESQLSNDFNEESSFFQGQVDKVRKEAYAGAAAGLAAGPFGLIISYSIAAGVVEGKLVPALKEKFKSVETFFKALKDKVQGASVTIDETKLKLENEISAISEMSAQTKVTRTYVDFDDLMMDLLKDAAGKLITQCNEYQKRHGKK